MKSKADWTQVDLLQELRERYPSALLDCLSVQVWPGWADLVRELVDELASSDPGVRVRQIKSKYGELRCYMRPSQDLEAVARFAAQASKICELCGSAQGVTTGPVLPPAPSILSRLIRRLRGQRPARGVAWIWTVCPECRIKLSKS